MGAFYNFAGLRQYADKLVKFKQGILLQAARHKGLISEEHFQFVKGGVCAALVMHWLQQKFGGPVDFSHGQGISIDQIGRNLDIITAASWKQRAYNEDEAPNRIHTLAGKWNIETTLADSSSTLSYAKSKDHFGKYPAETDDFFKLAMKWVEILKVDAAAYIYYDVYDGDIRRGTHAVGMFNPGVHQSRCDFFDPNIGEYRIHAGQESQVFSKYLQLIGERLEMKTIKKCKGFKAKIRGQNWTKLNHFV